MTRKDIHRLVLALLLCCVQVTGTDVFGQADWTDGELGKVVADSLRLAQGEAGTAPMSVAVPDSVAGLLADSLAETADSIAAENRRKLQALTSVQQPVQADSLAPDSLSRAARRNRVWLPDPTKATWLALVFPGGGQIYNRKYWKLPIIYGGFAGCAYALSWNGKMYRDYSRAYRDAVNNNWSSSNIVDLFPAGYLDQVSTSQVTDLLRRRKDTFRRYRDLSIFAFIGVYLLSVVDAYVDAELSNFDISPDLSMGVAPTVIDGQTSRVGDKSVGVQWHLRF